MTSKENPQTPATAEWLSKALATLDAVSGYTFAAITVAGDLLIGLPSPALGIDLSPLRAGWWGAGIAGATILAGCLAMARLLRFLHHLVGTRRAAVYIGPRPIRSHWGIGKLGNEPIIHIHAELTLTNPGPASLVVVRVEAALGRAFARGAYQEVRAFQIDDQFGGQLGFGPALSARNTGLLELNHLHRGKIPPEKQSLRVYLRLTDQFGIRRTVRLAVRHMETPP